MIKKYMHMNNKLENSGRGKGIRNLCIDADSIVTMKLLTVPPIYNNHYAHMARHWLSKDWHEKIAHIFPEGNSVAAALIGKGHDFPFGIHWFDFGPSFCCNMLLADSWGVSYSWRIPL